MKEKNILVTGGAGFIGSNAVDTLIELGNTVVVYDNLSSGRFSFIEHLTNSKNFKFVKGNLNDTELLNKTFKENDLDLVVHLAANANIVEGMKNPLIDLNNGILATHSVLESTRKHDVKDIIFSSTSAVYGNAKIVPTPEDYTERSDIMPVSTYAAAKLASESMIKRYSDEFGLDYMIYRFANVVGRNYSHGILLQMVEKLAKDNAVLEVIGHGRQKRAYVLVNDLINAVIHTYDKRTGSDIFNISTDELLSVDQVVRRIINRVSKDCIIKYTMDTSALLGDVNETHISNEKLKMSGFVCRYDSAAAVDITVEHLVERSKR